MYTIASPRFAGLNVVVDDNGTDIISQTYCPPADAPLCVVFGVARAAARTGVPTRLVFAGVEIEVRRRDQEYEIRANWEAARGPRVTLDMINPVWAA